MHTKDEIKYVSHPYYITATIPAGTNVVPADNLPDGGWWALPWADMSESDASWMRCYGFLLTDEQVGE